MGARYASTGFQTPVAATFKTMLELKAGTTVRPRVYDFLMGASGTPADNALEYALQKTTAAVGVGTSVTPEPLDPADVAALVTVLEDLTTEPTLAGIPIFDIGVNLRASYRWVAAPDSEIIIAAVANEGLAAMVLSSAYTGQAEATLMHEE